ncbi:FixH family protein [Variovorax sp. CAN15]|uniref:FixH family protein n=1 Tax=Variovorax sp. CAN15 TaxID=3046727 RepID=UPI0026475918|nr:FixH family protein [Variovorax sp. CAN15]
MNAVSDSTVNAMADKPWWRHPLLWMVIGGPAVVVIASFVTFWLAWRNPDALVSQDYYREGVEINKTFAKKHLPALTGRNHATTPAEDMPPVVRKAAP